MSISTSNAEDGTNHGQIWFQEFDKFLDFTTKIFGHTAHLVQCEDWELILSVEAGRPDYPLRLLFYPHHEDYWLNNKKHKNPWPLPPNYWNEQLPQLSNPYQINDYHFDWHHPRFLRELNEEDYHFIFLHLMEN